MLGTFSISRQGESHIRHELPCQDSSASFAVPAEGEPRLVGAVVADGVGSEPQSDVGSRVAVDTVAQSLRTALEADEQPEDMLLALEDAFEAALDAVLDAADEQGLPFSQFATTLTAGVFDGSTLWFGHAGDDGIVVMHTDGTYEMVTARHEGELANSVVPFGVHHWQFGEATDVASCVLMTDGVLDFCVRDESENNRVRLPFLKPLLYAVLATDEEVEAARQSWDEFLTTDFQKAVKDDLSIALLTRSEAVAELPAYSFDVEAWDEETARYQTLREERLEELGRERLEQDARYRRYVQLGQERVVHQEQAMRHQQPDPDPVGEPDGTAPVPDAADAVQDPGAPVAPVPAASVPAATASVAPAPVTPGPADPASTTYVPVTPARASHVPVTPAPAARTAASGGMRVPTGTGRPGGPPAPHVHARPNSDRSRAARAGARDVIKGIRLIGSAVADVMRELLQRP